MAAEYIIYKDTDYPAADFLIAVTGGGLTDAEEITYALVPFNAGFSGDLDVLVADADLIKDMSVHGGVAIVNDETFSVTLSPADTAELKPGKYWAIVRVITEAGVTMRLPKHEVEVAT